MTVTLNYIITTVVIAFTVLGIYYCFKKDMDSEEDENRDKYNIDYLSTGIKNNLSEVINMDIADLGLNKTETEKRIQIQEELNEAQAGCSFGDDGKKTYVKSYIENLLQKNFGINESSIDQVLSFSEPSKLNSQDKWEILLHQYKKEYDGKAFKKILEENNIMIEKEYEDGIYHEINQEDVDRVFDKVKPILSYVDKLNIVSQRIYQKIKGLGVVDELRDQSCLDGVSGGVSGIVDEDYNYMEEVIHQNEKRIFRHDSVWVLYEGKSIHLSFLSFGSKGEIERVCKKIYQYDAPYYLAGIKGKVVAEDKKGNRITVARPPFTESWKFFVRKFDSVQNLTIEKLITDEGCEIVINLLKYLVMACMVMTISGNQAVGKTTLLKMVIRFLAPTLNIGVEEDEFETWLNKIYPNRNITMFRKTDYISQEEGMDFQKKTDRDVMILGEVAEQNAAALLIQLTQFTRMTICTNHLGTTKKMIEYFRNALLSRKIFNSEKEAEEQVASAIQFDIHMKRGKNGHRYIERITEIIPVEMDDFPENCTLKEAWMLYLKKNIKKRYDTKDIIVFENGRYVVKNMISQNSLDKIRENLEELKEDKEWAAFQIYYEKYFSDLGYINIR